jgi:DNA modification methylase
MTTRAFKQVEIANPGNVIHCKVGGGLMGSPLAHENEAPFPEKLAEFFVKSFCPPEGIVLDPFCGSGTTLAVAKRLNRHYQGIDIRQSQVDLATRRLECTTNS